MSAWKLAIAVVAMVSPAWAQCQGESGLFTAEEVMALGEVLTGQPVDLEIDILFTNQPGNPALIVEVTGPIQFVDFDRVLPVGQQGNVTTNMTVVPTAVGPQTAQVSLNVACGGVPAANPGRVNISYTGQQQGSTLSGTVVNASGEGLAGASILVRDENSSSVFGTVADGDGNYTIADLPPGTYKITASTTGYESTERTFFHGDSGTVKKFLLVQETTSLDDIVVAGVANAASNRPAYVPGSSLAPGAMMVGYTRNGGPAELAVTSTTDLQRELSGFSGYVETAGERYDIYPVYTVATQFAAVLDADTPPGFGNLFISYNGALSDPFRIHVAESQPGIFTHTQDGQGAAIVTTPDFQLVTPDNPLNVGDIAIVWGSDGSSFDDQPGVEDRRALFDIDLYLGGFRVPDEKVRYYGPSGGFAGGLQIIFDVFEGAPTGCNVPFFVRVRSGDQSWLSNITGIPISGGESHCGDRHALANDLLAQLYSNRRWRRLTATVTESATYDGEQIFRGGFSTLRGFEFTKTNRETPPASNALALSWGANGIRVRPPLPLELTGSYSLGLPWTSLQFDASGIPSYSSSVNFPQSDAITEGPYSASTSADFTVGGTPFQFETNGTYRRRAGRLLELAEDALTAQYARQQLLTLGDVVDAVRETGALDGDMFVRYDLFVDDGPLGSYNLEGYVFGDSSPTEFPRSYYDQQQQMIFDHLFPKTAENVSIELGVSHFDTNRVEHQGGVVNESEEVFDAVATFRVAPGEYARSKGLDIPF